MFHLEHPALVYYFHRSHYHTTTCTIVPTLTTMNNSTYLLELLQALDDVDSNDLQSTVYPEVPHRAPQVTTSQRRIQAVSSFKPTSDDALAKSKSSSFLTSEEAVAKSSSQDKFLHFSNDKTRMEHLLGRELPHMSSEEPVKRKTCISFEVDPTFALLNSFPDLLDGPPFDASIDDILFDYDEMKPRASQ